MKTARHLGAIGLTASLLLAGCGSDSSGDVAAALAQEKDRERVSSSATTKTTTSATTPTVAAAVTVPTGRLLASNCFGCHGTNGRSNGGFDSLAGESASEIVSELKEMRTKLDEGIMRVHALGYTDQQIWELATFLASQR